jgi:hypothetical protein
MERDISKTIVEPIKRMRSAHGLGFIKSLNEQVFFRSEPYRSMRALAYRLCLRSESAVEKGLRFSNVETGSLLKELGSSLSKMSRALTLEIPTCNDNAHEGARELALCSGKRFGSVELKKEFVRAIALR